jgi:hypothetical protein
MQLVVVDTTGIQPYIFGSNRLGENIGASYLVSAATRNWPKELICKLTDKHNLKPNCSEIDPNRRIEEHSLDAEVVYAGGGNFVTLFREEGLARRFIGELSRKALTLAPNLQLVVVQLPFDWEDSEGLEQSFEDVFYKHLKKRKQAGNLSAPLLGLGVTVMCQSTGWPAVGVTEPIDDDPGYPASAKIQAKLQVKNKANERLCDLISPPADYDYPLRFDHLGGSKGEHNYIAVVHADGDGMGQRIKKILSEAKNNRDLINNLRDFSQAVEDASLAALVAMKDTLSSKLEDGKVSHPHPILGEELNVPLSRDRKTVYLPFRPLVFGGDDVTFVCDGRLGLSLAVEYLRRFRQETATPGRREKCRGEITASAGIAIVKSHYPFARAYDLAEQLCQSAKRYRRKHELTGSCLDWHFALSGLSGGIEEIREREYVVPSGQLNLRPVTLDANPKERQRSWQVVQKGVEAFQTDEWLERRNKIKVLRDALRDGPEAVKQFLTMFEIEKLEKLPLILSGYQDFEKTGWVGPGAKGFCGYFDAIEMADWFIPLEGGRADENAAASAT